MCQTREDQSDQDFLGQLSDGVSWWRNRAPDHPGRRFGAGYGSNAGPIGVREGWSCLDIGCGPGGITGLLSKRVGSTGRVVGLDMNAGFLEHARATAPSNVEFLLADAYSSNLPAGTFDLVHMRFLACTSGEPERLLREAKRLARSGGLIALQEADVSTLNCYPPHPSWERLKAALFGAFKSVGADVELARRLYYIVCQAGLAGVQFRPFTVGVRSSDPMVDYLPSNR